jgi:hypothetical protein
MRKRSEEKRTPPLIYHWAFLYIAGLGIYLMISHRSQARHSVAKVFRGDPHVEAFNNPKVRRRLDLFFRLVFIAGGAGIAILGLRNFWATR